MVSNKKLKYIFPEIYKREKRKEEIKEGIKEILNKIYKPTEKFFKITSLSALMLGFIYYSMYKEEFIGNYGYLKFMKPYYVSLSKFVPEAETMSASKLLEEVKDYEYSLNLEILIIDSSYEYMESMPDSIFQKYIDYLELKSEINKIKNDLEEAKQFENYRKAPRPIRKFNKFMLTLEDIFSFKFFKNIYK